jgi:hypothetical protein
MSTRSLARSAAVAILAVATLPLLPLSQASAFTLSSPSVERWVGLAPIDKVWWGWRGGAWGWWPGAVIGGLAAGAIIGSAAAPPYYYGPGYGYYGPGYYGPGYGYGRCWRWVAGPWGWHWARFC